MSKYKLFIVAEADNMNEKNTVLNLKRIKAADEETWYSFPNEFQGMNNHRELVDVQCVKSAVNSIKSRGQFRNINIIFSSELEKIYKDDAGNFVFNEYMLEEYQTLPSTQPSEMSASYTELVTCMNKLAVDKDESLREIMKHFSIEKFSTRNKNVEAWVNSFEKEANRFLLNGPKLIQAFRLCLDASMNDWFLNAQRRLGLETAWNSWKEDLISTFSDLSWKQIRYAYNFRYLFGSYVEFVVKKERILLELDHEIPEEIKLNLIVLGLPTQIQNSFNRSSVLTVRDLIRKLKKFEGESPKQIYNNEETSSKNGVSKSIPLKMNKPPSIVKSSTEKTPCSICERYAKGKRYHSENSCWFRGKNSGVVKMVNNVEIESDLNEFITDQKN